MSYWSKPYPDEILYSTIARNISYLGTKGPKQLLKRLFDRTTICSTLDLPSGIHHLAKHINIKDQTAEDLIDRHTLFQYYTRFIPENRRRKVWNSMLIKSGDIHTRCGIVTGPFPPLSTPRFCPICLNEQIELYGEPYLKLTHQIPSVNICTEHKILLNQVMLNYESINKHLFIDLYDYQSNLCVKKIIPFFNEEIIGLTSRLESLALKPLNSWPYDEPYIYNEEMKQLGFNKGQDSLDWSRIYNEFENFFAKSTLIHFRSEVSSINSNCWLKSILRKHRTSFDPVRHVLVNSFFEHLKSSKVRIPIQSNAYPCRNPVCKHYRKDTKTSFKTIKDRKSKRNITYVTCSCGFQYTSSYILEKNTHFIRVKEHGKKWETELTRLINLKYSLRSIARVLDTAPETIKRYLYKNEKYSTHLDNSIAHKNKWLNHIKENESLCITELRKLNQSLYMYLYRHEKEWLLSLSYPKKGIKSSPRINWIERDQKYLLDLQATFSNLRRNAPKVRRSRSLLLRLAKIDSTFQKNNEKLPRTMAFLSKHSETREAHRMRRLIIAYRELISGKKHLTYWTLLRKAGIREEYVSNDIHKATIHLLTYGLDSLNTKFNQIA